MTQITLRFGHGSGRRPASAGRARSATALQLRDTSRRLMKRLAEWRRRARGRWALVALNDDMLKDIGLGRSEAYREYSKPFWRP